jgi:hypothetical protein
VRERSREREREREREQGDGVTQQTNKQASKQASKETKKTQKEGKDLYKKHNTNLQRRREKGRKERDEGIWDFLGTSF